MSDSSIALKPVIDDPSKPIPSSSAPSSSLIVMAKLLRCPSRSVNQRSTSWMPRDSISASTSLRVSGSLVARFLLSTYAILPPDCACLKTRKAPVTALCGHRGSVASQVSTGILQAVRTERKLPSLRSGSRSRRPLCRSRRGSARVGAARGACAGSRVRRSGRLRRALPRHLPRLRARRRDGAVGSPGLCAAGLHVRPDSQCLLPRHGARPDDDDLDPRVAREREEDADDLVEEAGHGGG